MGFRNTVFEFLKNVLAFERLFFTLTEPIRMFWRLVILNHVSTAI